MKEYMKYTKEMLEFIENSPSCFHAIRNVKKSLEEQGFLALEEKEEWQLEAGKGYYVVRNDSSIIAFRMPETNAVKGFHMVATHSDSPTFKVKEAPEIMVEENYVKLNTEKYGGMILSTWLDRPLSIAGRVAVCEKENAQATEKGNEGNVAEKIVTKPVNIDKDLLVIPNLAIHMNRDMNKGVEYNPQIDMLPLFADGKESKGKGALLKKLAKAADVKATDILGYDLFLYVREKGRSIGEKGEFVLSPRLDDLQCVYASMKAFVLAQPKEYINICAVFDNEEVGSSTAQGADSTFLEDVLWRIAEGLKVSKTTYLQWLADSFLISADNAHAVHPNHPEKADPTNRPYLNSGIVIKYHGGQRYMTDAVSAARMKQLCKQAGVPFQTYANRSDVAGGSTLGNIATSHVSISGVDIGLPQLAMHSAVETAGTKDTGYAVRVFQEFWRA